MIPASNTASLPLKTSRNQDSRVVKTYPLAGPQSLPRTLGRSHPVPELLDPESRSWVESRAEIEITATGAVARHGQHRVIFSPNANDPEGAIDF